MIKLYLGKKQLCVIISIFLLYGVFVFFNTREIIEKFESNMCLGKTKEKECNDHKPVNGVNCIWSEGTCKEKTGKFDGVEAKLRTQRIFCKELKKLNKSKNYDDNLSFKLLTDFIEEKKLYINKLEKRIEKLLTHMHDGEIYSYNINKIREHDQAKKQIEAIQKGIENIENKNKIVLNLE
jgi:hypothetical protein